MCEPGGRRNLAAVGERVGEVVEAAWAVTETVILLTLSLPSLLVHQLKVEGGAAKWQSRRRLQSPSATVLDRLLSAAIGIPTNWLSSAVSSCRSCRTTVYVPLESLMPSGQASDAPMKRLELSCTEQRVRERQWPVNGSGMPMDGSGMSTDGSGRRWKIIERQSDDSHVCQ